MLYSQTMAYERLEDKDEWNLPKDIVFGDILEYADSRKTLGELTSVNTHILFEKNCQKNCPRYHMCYPTDKGDCELGAKKKQCCQLNVSNTPSAFLETVSHMHRYVTENQTNRGPASDGYLSDLGRIIPTTILNIVRSVFHPPARLDFFFRFKEEHHISDLHRLQIVRLGAKLFNVLAVRFLDDNELITQLEENSRLYITAYVTPRTTSIPRNILCYAVNIKLEVSKLNVEETDVIDDNDLLLTEQDVFDMIEHRLRAPNTQVCNAAIDAYYKGTGVGNFNGIIDACKTSSFRGIIVCSVDVNTNVEEGVFNGFSIEIMNPDKLSIPGQGWISRATKEVLVVEAGRALVIRK